MKARVWVGAVALAAMLGTAPAAAGVAPQTGIDSSHGNAIVTPMPRRKARRVH